MMKGILVSSKGVMIYIGIILVLAIAGFVSAYFYGTNKFQKTVEIVLDEEIESKLHLPDKSINIDLSAGKSDNK